MSNLISLADWRRRNAEMYAAVRAAPEQGRLVAWQHWRAARNDLFKFHPQSPLSAVQRERFSGLDYYDFDPNWRVKGLVETDVPHQTTSVNLAADVDLKLTQIARARFVVNDFPAVLSIFWIEGYGGGIFVPFRDATNSEGTFGGGRYLYDTIKGADLGVESDAIVLDFNYAYNPSCAYHTQWVCPLPPPENILPFAVTAGERLLPGFLVQT